MIELFANSGDPDQTRHSVASDLDLHCLPSTLLGVSRLWVKQKKNDIFYSLHLNICFGHSLEAPH